MQVCQALSFVIVSIILGFTAAILGLVRHNVLLDPSKCCETSTACSEMLHEQMQAYYDSVTGLRTRYIIAMFFFITSIFLNSVTLNPYISFLQYPAFLSLLALIAYSTLLLFADNTLHTFTKSPEHLLPVCSAISSLITEALEVFSWFVIIMSNILFYAFMVFPKTNEPSPLAMPFILTDEIVDEDEEEDSVFPDKIRP